MQNYKRDRNRLDDLSRKIDNQIRHGRCSTKLFDEWLFVAKAETLKIPRAEWKQVEKSIHKLKKGKRRAPEVVARQFRRDVHRKMMRATKHANRCFNKWYCLLAKPIQTQSTKLTIIGKPGKRRSSYKKARGLLFARGFTCCCYCGRPFSGPQDPEVTAEHVIPLSQGGANTVGFPDREGNVRLCCARCNAQKNRKMSKNSASLRQPQSWSAPKTIRSKSHTRKPTARLDLRK